MLYFYSGLKSYSLQSPPENLPCHVVISPPFPVPEPDIFMREDPLVPAVDHELALRDGPVLVNVHPSEQSLSKLVCLILVVLVVQQTQDGLNNLKTKRQYFLLIRTRGTNSFPSYSRDMTCLTCLISAL